ncbi:MAG: hypothetical protein AABX28_01980 [Nanoarchaeota archaeon]
MVILTFEPPNEIDKKDVNKIVKSALDILETNSLLSLSTFDEKNKQPSVCSVYYAFDNDFNLYIWTDPKSQHSKNTIKNYKIGADIYDSHQEWGELLKGLQIEGKIYSLSNKELLVGGSLYLKRYLKASNFIKNIKDFNSTKFESKLYKIMIDKIKVLDEENFGKENYKILLIKRA